MEALSPVHWIARLLLNVLQMTNDDYDDKSNLACTYEIMRLTFKNNLQTDFQGKVNDIFVVIILCSSARGSRKYE